METVILVIHLLIAMALVGVILVQRSEGGALGIGGGGGGLASGRGAASALTRLTAYLAVAFFATSITLTILANKDRKPASSIIDRALEGPAKSGPPSADKPAVPAVPLVPKSQ